MVIILQGNTTNSIAIKIPERDAVEGNCFLGSTLACTAPELGGKNHT